MHLNKLALAIESIARCILSSPKQVDASNTTASSANHRVVTESESSYYQTEYTLNLFNPRAQKERFC